MRIAVLTSGGDAPGMNAAIRMFAAVAVAHRHEPFGVVDGFQGLLEDRVEPLGLEDVEGITRLGGTILGSSRARDFYSPAGREPAVAALAVRGLDGLVVLGGNGSLAAAHALAQETACQVVALPASIDNDIGHTRTCIGVDTAVNTIVEACDRISDTASAHRRAFIVEVMGRDSGFLAMQAGLAAEADAILVAESGRTEEELVDELVQLLRRRFTSPRRARSALIVKAEGVRIPTPELARRVRDALGGEEASITLRETVLGHVVRGGSPSPADRVIAQRLAFESVLAVEQGATDVMLGWDVEGEVGEPTEDPRVRRVLLEDVACETQRLRAGSPDLVRGRILLMEGGRGRDELSARQADFPAPIPLRPLREQLG